LFRLRSLSSRLIVYWIVGSLLAFFTIPVAVNLTLTAMRITDPETNLESWTTKRARTLVAEALRREADGSKHIEPTVDLRAYVERNPDFRFAVLDAETNALVPGSSAELAAFFESPKGLDLYGAAFHLSDDPNRNSRGLARTMSTPIGRAKVIVYGAYFHWDDALYQLYNYLTLANLLNYVPLAAVLSTIAVVVVRRTLAPLRTIAAKISHIDVNSLSQHIPSANLPDELIPFVDAVNSALERVDQGVTRQKRFTANSAHELRTPITILTSRVEKMADVPLKRDIQRDVRRIRTIVEQLLILAQLEERSGRTAQPPELDLVGAVRSAVADLAPLALDNDRRIELDAPTTPVVVHAHRWAIESVVTNLIENAVRMEPKNGLVVVRVTRDAIVEVVDHGVGVPLAEREMIFEPFWRKDDGTLGTGLGLAIARELVHQMGGEISIDNNLGGGATFRVDLRRDIALRGESTSFHSSKLSDAAASHDRRFG
jgi:signal transduction histidine kinase